MKEPIYSFDQGAGSRYVLMTTPEAFASEQIAAYRKRDEPKLIAARLEAFLAKILRATAKAVAA
jgi:hypothetical protein